MKHDDKFFDDVDEVIKRCEENWPSNPTHIVIDTYHKSPKKLNGENIIRPFVPGTMDYD